MLDFHNTNKQTSLSSTGKDSFSKFISSIQCRNNYKYKHLQSRHYLKSKTYFCNKNRELGPVGGVFDGTSSPSSDDLARRSIPVFEDADFVWRPKVFWYAWTLPLLFFYSSCCPWCQLYQKVDSSPVLVTLSKSPAFVLRKTSASSVVCCFNLKKLNQK